MITLSTTATTAMSRKVTATVTATVTIDLEEGVSMDDALMNLGYNFFLDPDEGNVVDQDITAMCYD
jgi:hypothetical protein